MRACLTGATRRRTSSAAIGSCRQFDFTPKDHVVLGEALGGRAAGATVAGMDFEAAGQISGARFVVMTGAWRSCIALSRNSCSIFT